MLIIDDSNFIHWKNLIMRDWGYIVDSYSYASGLFSTFPTDNTMLAFITISGISLTATTGGVYKNATCLKFGVNTNQFQIAENNYSQVTYVKTPYIFVSAINTAMRNATNYHFNGYLFTLNRTIQK